MRKRRFPIILLLGILSSSLAFAQTQTGAIEGIVQGNDGRPIPGTIIRASSPSLIGGSRNAYTDENGYYRFPALSPGTYEVHAQLSGFETEIRKDIRVFVGRTLTVDFSIELVKISETLEVTEKPPLIDVSTTAVVFTIPPEILSNLPKLQGIQNLLALTPGVGDDLIAYGADGAKANRIWMDGVNVTSPRHGNLWNEYNYNWIDEVQVTGIGAPAEYGGFTGVIGNFITRSGGNQFHGLFETFFQNKNLISTNTPDPGLEVPFENYDVTAQLGGPVFRDKLWFFSGLQYSYNQTHPFGYDGVTTGKFPKFITKLNYKWDENNSLQGFLNRNDYYTDGGGAEAFVLPEATVTNKNRQSSWNATWLSLLSSQTTFEARFGGLHNYYRDVEDNPDLPSHTDSVTGITSVNAPSRSFYKQSRVQLNATLSHHARNFIHGGHDFRFGIEFERSNAIFGSHYNGGLFYFDYNGAPYYRYLLSGYIFDGSNRRVSTFAQDEWNVTDRLSLSLGVRWDHNRGITDRGVVYKTDPVAPRLGLVWMLNKESQTVIKAHFGDYYEGLIDRNYYFLSDNQRTDIYQRYNSDGQWEEVFRVHQDFYSAGDLKQPRVRQFTIGIDRVLPGNIPFGAHYIYRRFGNILEDIGIDRYEPVPFVNPLTGETITVYNPLDHNRTFILTNPTGLYRRYDGVEFFANKQLGNKLSFSGSFVYSKLRGNSPGDNGFPGAHTPFMDNPNTLINFPGRLKDDPTIAWKVVGTYALPLGLNAGWYFRHASGDRWTPQVLVRTVNAAFRILGEPAGSRRLPSQNLLDLRVEKEFPVYSGRLRFTADVFNVFNRGYVLRIEDRFEVSTFGQPRLYNEPRRIQLGVRYTF